MQVDDLLILQGAEQHGLGSQVWGVVLVELRGVRVRYVSLALVAWQCRCRADLNWPLLYY